MKVILTSFLMSFSIISWTQVGNTFPKMEAESLSNQLVNLPKDISGKYSLIALAYSKKAEDDLKTWFEPIFNQFIYKNPNPGPFDFSFDMNCYFVPMFSGVKRPAYRKVMNKAKETISDRFHNNVLFYKGTIKKYKEKLKFDDKNLPYFFVLDTEGKIVYATAGRYTTHKMQEITDAVESAMVTN